MYKTLSDIAKQLQRIADALELIAKNQNFRDYFEKLYKGMQQKEPKDNY